MHAEETIRNYLKALETGSYESAVALFEEDALVISPLYGEIKAVDFYRELFADTINSKITLLNIFIGAENKAAGHFLYDWVLKNGTKTSFECVDVFEFSASGKIKKLTIIYDTSKIRSSFEEIKK